MATTFPISLPTTGTKRIRIAQAAVVGVGQSPFTLEQQVQRRQGQSWILDVSYPPMIRATAEALHAALCSLNGREGTFLFGDSASKTPRGTATGTPLVKGASQTGEDLITDGWTINITGILKAGDWIQLGTGSTSRLYKVLGDANSNGTGDGYGDGYGNGYGDGNGGGDGDGYGDAYGDGDGNGNGSLTD